MEQGGSDELDILPLQNKLHDLLGSVSAQMLAEDGITVASYMAGTDDTGASLCPRKVHRISMLGCFSWELDLIQVKAI